MTANHTPGPWSYRPDSSKHGEFVIGPANSAPTASNVVAFAVLPHNAPLIAAAPDLLAALEGCADALKEAGKSFALNNPLAHRPNLFELHEAEARAAIAKVKGED